MRDDPNKGPFIFYEVGGGGAGGIWGVVTPKKTALKGGGPSKKIRDLVKNERSLTAAKETRRYVKTQTRS